MELIHPSIRCVEKCDTHEVDSPLDLSHHNETCQCDTGLNQTGQPSTVPNQQLPTKNPLLSFTIKAKKLTKLQTPEWVPSPQSSIQLSEPERVNESKLKMKDTSTKLNSPKRETTLSSKISLFYRQVYLNCTKVNCTMTFTERRVRDEHVLRNHQENPYFCPLTGCQRSFPSKKQMEAHLAQHRPEVDVLCGPCGSLIRSGINLKLHFFSYHELGKYDCTQDGCSFTASNRKSVYNHFQMHHLSGSETGNGDGQLGHLTCYQINRQHAKIRTSAVLCWVEGCLQYQLTQVDLDLHLEVAHSISHFRCSFEHCGESFHLNSQLIAHIQVFHGPHAIWPCSKCCLNYATAWDLHQHNVFHHHEGIYRCEKCPYIRKFRAEIVQHYDRDHL